MTAYGVVVPVDEYPRAAYDAVRLRLAADGIEADRLEVTRARPVAPGRVAVEVQAS